MEFLEKLINTYGISGDEEEIRELINKEIKRHVDDTFIDKFGNLIAHKKGKEPRIMLAAHMDEIGLMIKNIKKDGRISFVNVGGLVAETLVGNKIHVKTKNGVIHGIITTAEISSDANKINPPSFETLIIDTGLTRKELLEKGVEIGSYISLEQKFDYLGSKDYIFGKALDDRIGCYVLVEVAKRLKKSKYDIFFVFTVQEEIGLYGALTSVHAVVPHLAVAVDTTSADDFTENPTRKLGKGLCIIIKDAEMIGNKCINDWIKNIARNKKIPMQLNVSEIGTTDALSISTSKGGIPSTAIAIPVRNIHTIAGIAHRKDIEHTIILLEELLRNPPLKCLT